MKLGAAKSVLTPKDVFEAPANYNRATRRWARVLFRWDPRALGIPADTPPRYVRRHYNDTILTNPTNRRQRRHKARILRAMKGRV